MDKICENCNWFQQANNETYCNKLDEWGIENSDAEECEYWKNKQDGWDVVKEIIKMVDETNADFWNKQFIKDTIKEKYGIEVE